MMKHLFDDWVKAEKKLRSGHVYLLMDFDGTLAAIKRHPASARLSARAAAAVKNLVRRSPDVSAAVISGRGLGDIRRRVGIKGVIYAGNHGLEVYDRGRIYFAPGAEGAKKTIGEIAGKLKKALRGLDGVVLEDKGLTISVHYRMVRSPRDLEKAGRILEETVAPYKAGKSVIVTPGKKIWEVRPPVKWDKGKTALWLVGKKRKELGKKVLPVCLGDDVTDEDAFRAIGDKGLCVFVGRPAVDTRAGYYLKGPGEVVSLLRKVMAIKGRGAR